MSVILIMLESSYFKVKQGVQKCRCIIREIISHLFIILQCGNSISFFLSFLLTANIVTYIRLESIFLIFLLTKKKQ
jgi:hypothetical protein